MRSNFEPINLQSASRHIDWLIDKTKKIYSEPTKSSFWQKFINLLTRIF